MNLANYTEIKGKGYIPVEDSEEGAAGHEGGDDGEVGRLRTCPHEQHHVWVLQPLHQRHLSPELLHGTPTAHTLTHMTHAISQSLRHADH